MQTQKFLSKSDILFPVSNCKDLPPPIITPEYYVTNFKPAVTYTNKNKTKKFSQYESMSNSTNSSLSKTKKGKSKKDKKSKTKKIKKCWFHFTEKN